MVTDNTGVSQPITFMKYLYLDDDDVLMEYETSSEDDKAPEAPIQCSGCKKKFFSDGFKVTRLGKRLKTCIECNKRHLVKKQEYLTRKDAGTNDISHGAICKRDPARIDEEARRKHGVRLLDPSTYKNARTEVYWECITCQRHFKDQWQFIHTRKIACNSCASEAR